MAGFNRLALESNSIYGLLKDVHKIRRCHTNKKNCCNCQTKWN